MRSGGYDSAASVLILFFGAILVSSNCYPDRDQQNHWTLNAYFENDLFSETDQAYTNGIRFSWVSPDLADYIEDANLPPWLRQVNQSLTFFHSTRKGLQRNLVFSLGQTIYTPENMLRQ